jgi:hypothetical protein
MAPVSRRALLTRAGLGSGAGVIALLGGAAVPALAAPTEIDLASVRLICSSKRLMINWYTRWLNTHLENLMIGIGIGAVSVTADVDVASSMGSIIGGDGQHISALSALTGETPVPTALPRALGVENASAQLAPFLPN